MGEATGRRGGSTSGARGREGAPPAAGEDGAGGGQARRRARTHEALLAAGRELVARGAEDASIEEITRLAGVGFGSFANHFPEGKAAFFHRAALGVLAGLGEEIGRLAAEHDDPVDAVAAGFRATIRLAHSEPTLRAVLLRPGTDVLFAADTLLAAARHDIERGVSSRQFVDADPDLLLVGVGSVLIGVLRLLEKEDADAGAGRAAEGVAEDACAAVLRLLGVDRGRALEAARAAAPSPVNP